MDLTNQLGLGGVGLNEALGKFFGVRGRVANALNARNLRDVIDEQSKINPLPIFERKPIRVDILSESYSFLWQPKVLI